jgi:hypothetical protein
MDSWYTSEKVINTCNRKGFHVIAAVRTNRLICPSGIPIAISDYAEKYIRKADLHSVTVDGQGIYRVYPYEGPVSEIENVKLLLSWKDDYPLRANRKFVFCVRMYRWISLRFRGTITYAGTSRRGIATSRICWGLTNTKSFPSPAFSGSGQSNS